MRRSRSDTGVRPAPTRPAPAPRAPAPCSLGTEGLRLRVHVTPRAGAERVGAVVGDGRTARLRLAVTAPPREGEANAAVVALLARALRLPKSAFTVVAGASGREKTVAIAGDATAIAARIDALLAALPAARPVEGVDPR